MCTDNTLFTTKTVNVRKKQIGAAAAGQGMVIRGMQPGSGPVVDWGLRGPEGRDPQVIPGRIHTPGPNASYYEKFREHCGAHLVFNAFWNIQHFCAHQMMTRDPMHQVDMGIIIHLIRAILRKFRECVEDVLGMP